MQMILFLIIIININKVIFFEKFRLQFLEIIFINKSLIVIYENRSKKVNYVIESNRWLSYIFFREMQVSFCEEVEMFEIRDK